MKNLPRLKGTAVNGWGNAFFIAVLWQCAQYERKQPGGGSSPVAGTVNRQPHGAPWRAILQHFLKARACEPDRASNDWTAWGLP